MTSTSQPAPAAAHRAVLPGALPLPARVQVPPGAVVLGVGDPHLHAVEDPHEEHRAADFARDEAARRRVPLVVLHGSDEHRVLDPSTSWADGELVEHGAHVAGWAADRLRRKRGPEGRVITVSSPLPATDALVSASQEAGLVVLRAGVRRAGGLRPGAVLRSVAVRATCPVAVLRGRDPSDAATVVVGVDGAGRSRAALHTAMDEALACGDRVVSVHAWDVPRTVPSSPTLGELQEGLEAAQRLLAEALAGLGEEYPTVEVERRLVRGAADDVLTEAGRDARLLVVARHARSAVGFHALGSTVRALLHRPGCPVLLAPPAPPVQRPRRVPDVPVGPGY